MLESDTQISGELLEASFAAAVAASDAGIVISNPLLPDNPIVYANAAFEKITGYKQTEIIGRNCRFLQGPIRVLMRSRQSGKRSKISAASRFAC